MSVWQLNELHQAHKDMNPRDFELRHRYLTLALTAIEAFLGELTFLYELVDSGNNFFESRAEYDRVFSRWTEQGNIVLSRIRGVLNSDKQRYQNIQKAKKG